MEGPDRIHMESIRGTGAARGLPASSKSGTRVVLLCLYIVRDQRTASPIETFDVLWKYKAHQFEAEILQKRIPSLRPHRQIQSNVLSLEAYKKSDPDARNDSHTGCSRPS